MTRPDYLTPEQVTQVVWLRDVEGLKFHEIDRLMGKKRGRAHAIYQRQKWLDSLARKQPVWPAILKLAVLIARYYGPKQHTGVSFWG